MVLLPLVGAVGRSGAGTIKHIVRWSCHGIRFGDCLPFVNHSAVKSVVLWNSFHPPVQEPRPMEAYAYGNGEPSVQPSCKPKASSISKS